MSFGARCLYIVLRSYLRHDNANNGKVFRSHRDVCVDLGRRSRSSVVRWYRELQHYGFVVQTSGAHLGVDGDGISAHWRLTECPSFDPKGNLIAATRDFDRWDGTLFDDPSKTETRTYHRSTPDLPQVHTGPLKAVENDAEVDLPQVHRAPPQADLPQVHNLLPLPTTLKPHTEDLTEMVLRIVHEQLDELAVRKHYPRAQPTPEWHGYTKLPVEVGLLALGLPLSTNCGANFGTAHKTLCPKARSKKEVIE
jgi:hypothetical protein